VIRDVVQLWRSGITQPTAQAVGWRADPPPPFPVPRRAGEGESKEVGAIFTQGWRPGLRYSAPSGLATWRSTAPNFRTDFCDRRLAGIASHDCLEERFPEERWITRHRNSPADPFGPWSRCEYPASNCGIKDRLARRCGSRRPRSTLGTLFAGEHCDPEGGAHEGGFGGTAW
jgi:hypothetical protein